MKKTSHIISDRVLFAIFDLKKVTETYKFLQTVLSEFEKVIDQVQIT